MWTVRRVHIKEYAPCQTSKNLRQTRQRIQHSLESERKILRHDVFFEKYISCLLGLERMAIRSGCRCIL